MFHGALGRTDAFLFIVELRGRWSTPTLTELLHCCLQTNIQSGNALIKNEREKVSLPGRKGKTVDLVKIFHSTYKAVDNQYL